MPDIQTRRNVDVLYDTDAPPPYYGPGTIHNSLSFAKILVQPLLVIQRQKNRKLGLLKSTKYLISDASGNHIGYIEEEESDLPRFMIPNGTGHKPFGVKVLNDERQIVATIRREQEVGKSETKVFVPSGRKGFSKLVGISTQEWNLFHDRYNLLLHMGHEKFVQFGTADAHISSFTFDVRDNHSKLLGLLDRNWVGSPKKLRNNPGVYLLKMDAPVFDLGPGSLEVVSSEVLTLDQRAVLLGTILSLDFDFFSGTSRERASNMGAMISI